MVERVLLIKQKLWYRSQITFIGLEDNFKFQHFKVERKNSKILMIAQCTQQNSVSFSRQCNIEPKTVS